MKVLVVYSSMYGPIHLWSSENELVAARFQGKYVAQIAAKLAR